MAEGLKPKAATSTPLTVVSTCLLEDNTFEMRRWQICSVAFAGKVDCWRSFTVTWGGKALPDCLTTSYQGSIVTFHGDNCGTHTLFFPCIQASKDRWLNMMLFPQLDTADFPHRRTDADIVAVKVLPKVPRRRYTSLVQTSRNCCFDAKIFLFQQLESCICWSKNQQKSGFTIIGTGVKYDAILRKLACCLSWYSVSVTIEREA